MICMIELVNFVVKTVKRSSSGARTLGRSESEERAGVRERDRSSGLDGGTRTRMGIGTETDFVVPWTAHAKY
jgi:hypothetical protein